MDALQIADDMEGIGTRRSGRVKRAPAKYDDEYAIPNSKSPAQPATKQNRPKRKAAQTATQNIVPEDAGPALEDILSRMSPDERKEYNGWVELESDPGFFGAMLHDLGAKDFMIQEIYTLDVDTWKELPQPVHGLIFLFEYEGGEDDSNTENRPSCPDHLWFANQTTANSCATVALINIVMNAQGANLGTQLQEFKNTTQKLPPPHRGHFLDRNDFIRSIHNSLARRIDLVAEDLALDNKSEEAQKKKKAAKKTGTSKRKKRTEEMNYHYIAYVPVDGQVWELDGFQSKPLSLGPIPQSPDTWWLDTASSAIQERMMRNSEFSSYNLLAICQSPLEKRKQELIQNIASTIYLHAQNFDVPDPFLTFTNDRLARLNVTRDAILASSPLTHVRESLEASGWDKDKARELGAELEAQREGLEVMLVAEIQAVEEMMEKFRGRQRDYTPAIHAWVRALAEKGVLRELIQEADREF